MVIERRQAEADTAIVPGSTSQTQTKVNYENDMHSISKSIDGVIGGIAAFQAVGLGSNPSQCYTAYLIVSIYLVHSPVYLFWFIVNCCIKEIYLPKPWQDSLPKRQQEWMSKCLYRFNPAAGML